MCSDEQKTVHCSSSAYMDDHNANVVVYERESVQNDEFARQLAYWTLQLANAPQVLDLPTDHPRPPIQRHHESQQNFALSRELTDALKTLSRQAGVPLYTTLVAAFQTLLYRYTGQEDLLLGTPTLVRKHLEVQGPTDYFLNILALRTDMSGDPTFYVLLERAQTVIVSAIHHNNIPFERIVDALHLEQDLSYHPLFQVMLSYQPQLLMHPIEQTLSSIDEHTSRSMCDLHLEIDDQPQGLTGRFVYNTDLFDASTISRMSGHWQTILEGIIADPTQPVTRRGTLSARGVERHASGLSSGTVRARALRAAGATHPRSGRCRL